MSEFDERYTSMKRPGNNGNMAPSAPTGNQYNQKHGLNALKKAWSKLGNRMIDGRSPAAVALGNGVKK